MAINATASSLVKEIRGSSIVDSNRTCSNRRSRKKKCGNSMSKSTSKVCALAVMEHFDTNIFLSLLSIFLDFIFLFFEFLFIFIFSDEEEACDITVT